MDNVGCSGSETTLPQCPHLSNHNCNHGKDASVVCQPCEFVYNAAKYIYLHH